MRSATLQLHATEAFPVPISTGYTVYGALLAKLQTIDRDISQHIHDSTFASLHNSGLLGTNGTESFGHSKKSYHKQITPGETYTLKLGVIDEDDIAIFDALADTFAFDNSPIELTHGNLHISDFNSHNTTYQELVETAEETDVDTLRLTFETLTGIKESGEVTTAFPHRRSVFRSLLRRWNKTCPDTHTFDFPHQDTETDESSPTTFESLVEAHLIEKPQYEALEHPSTYGLTSDGQKKALRTDSVVTKMIPNPDGHDYPHHLQGFLGTCDYQFKKPPAELQTAITTLAQFAEYAGIGSSVSRGCGTTTVELNP